MAGRGTMGSEADEWGYQLIGLNNFAPFIYLCPDLEKIRCHITDRSTCKFQHATVFYLCRL